MTHRIRTRFTASLVANMLRSGISFATGLLVARWLGPESFGRMAFLLVSLVAFRQLLDMASSSAFFTFISQRPRSRRFTAFYWWWIGLQFIFSLLVVGLLLPDDWMGVIWKGEGRGLVLLALVAAFMQNVVWPNASQMAEAQRETARVQHLNTLVVVVHLVVVLALWYVGRLVIPLLFVALALEWGVAGWFAARLYRGHMEINESGGESGTASSDTASSIWREYWHYCLPFVPYALLGFVYDFADRWMLQHWGGSTQQAYYAVASQFAVVVLLATASILRIFWKEIAEAHHRGDTAKVKRLYLKVSRALYFVGAVVAGGLLPWAGEIIHLTLGAAYAGGTVTLMLMFLYPVHQSMGQIGGTMLYATGHTHTYVVIGLLTMVSSLAVAYFMMAPKNYFVPGLALASQGLAWKMVVLQLLSVNFQARLISHIFDWKFDWGYQIVGLGLAVAAGWLTKFLVTGLVVAPIVIHMASAVPIYLILMAIVLYLLPWVAGLTRGELGVYLQPVRRWIPDSID